MADSIMLETAQRRRGTFWTQDPDFEDLPGVKYYANIRALWDVLSANC